jgi:hypothetical protein
MPLRFRIRLPDPSRASDLRVYFRRLDALAIDNENGTLDVHLLKLLLPACLGKDGGVPVELLE